MRAILDRILTYSLLPPEEQVVVEAYVLTHPHLAPWLERAQTWGRLFKEAHVLQRDPVEDDALAYYAVLRHIQHNRLPPTLEPVIRQLEAHLQADPELQQRYETYVHRLAGVSALMDPWEQFERLTALPLPGRDAAPQDAPGALHVGEARVPYAAAPVPPARPPRRYAGMRILLAVLALAYGLLWGAGRTYAPDYARLSRAAAPADLLERAVAFPDAAEAPPPAALYLLATTLLHEGYQTTLGLFPRYDARHLQTGARLLEQTLALETPATPLYQEAGLLLARVRLLQDDVPAARRTLEAVADGAGRRAGDARLLLHRLDAR